MGGVSSSNLRYAFSFVDFPIDHQPLSNENRVCNIKDTNKYEVKESSDNHQLNHQRSSPSLVKRRNHKVKLQDQQNVNTKSQNQELFTKLSYKEKHNLKLSQAKRASTGSKPKENTNAFRTDIPCDLREENAEGDPYGVRRFQKGHYFELFKAESKPKYKFSAKYEDQKKTIQRNKYNESDVIGNCLYVSSCNQESGSATNSWFPRESQNEDFSGECKEEEHYKGCKASERGLEDDRCSLKSVDSTDLLDRQSSNIQLEMRNSSYCMSNASQWSTGVLYAEGEENNTHIQMDMLQIEDIEC